MVVPIDVFIQPYHLSTLDVEDASKNPIFSSLCMLDLYECNTQLNLFFEVLVSIHVPRGIDFVLMATEPN